MVRALKGRYGCLNSILPVELSNMMKVSLGFPEKVSRTLIDNMGAVIQEGKKRILGIRNIYAKH